ncbi:hypothetical protein PsorP6_006581 [Peronosclerospora sorghi]|uniref:Uncharacterized protein n=1 Tax=Peronosclerospora sorghi TaxID=230839 RepID=A0ACC0W3E8_9STRA|nr:hypothetical protein PsorP6_006581 [Peronosclerospora sorghi]
MTVRAWSWTRLDGRNVVALPTQTEIHLYDSDDFVLLSRLAPSGHRSPVAFVRWSGFHGKLASLSADQILVHAPQRDPQQRSCVQLVSICSYRLDGAHASIRGLSFSRTADELLVCGRDTGLYKLDVRTPDHWTDEAPVVWRKDKEDCDVAKYSPSAFVFATLRRKEREVKVWRMRRRLGDADKSQRLDRVETLKHEEPVVCFAWRPTTMQGRSALESDGTRKAQWFEPPRILLTCTRSRTVNIWTENDTSCFNTVLVLDPTYSMDHVRWVIPKNKNISEETFQRVTDMHANRADWISAVDQNGVLKLWRVSGVMSQSLHAEETSVQLKINGHDNQPGANLEIRLRDVCVMAYFSQNYVGMPSKLDLVLQREDHMLMSFQVAVGEVDRPVAILKKSWYRSHRGSISALSAHPSLPLVASVDTFTSDGTWTYEVLVYWISFSAFSARSRLIPSGVLPCEKNSGKVLCIQWVPTLHFDATPLLLVGYESGAIDVYGRCARDRVAVVSSPRVKVPQHQRKVTRSPTLSPWTFYNYETGESGFEYEVLYKNSNENELSLQFEENNGKLLVVRNWSSDRFLSEIIEGDELVGINNKSIVGKKGKDVLALIDQNSRNEVILMRFRAACAHEYQEKSLIEKTVSQSSTSARATSNPSNLGTFGSTVDNNERKSRNLDHVVHAVAVSMYGGWKNVLHTEAAPQLSRLCICPSYADDGGYVPDSVLIFGIESLPGQLYVWKGLRGSTTQSFELVPLQIQNPAIQKKANITSIASERDYRQRAFSSNRTQGNNSLNSLIFIGDAAGYIEHWRCQAVGNTIYFTMMGSHRVCGNDSFSLPNGHQVRESMGLFCRRGYVSTHPMNVCPESYDAAAAGVGGVSQIEVDDPNRLAVLHADRPEKLHVFEAESGLGILRLEETISSNGRGNILGFCWCSSHVEFNVDALAVKYEAAIVMYQYDTTTHRWSQIGDDIVTQLSLFDCTRDSSALLIGGGHLNDTRVDQSSSQLVSNNMLLVMSKWDEPGSLLQRSMDWKAAEPPQKLPVWHPYVLLTTMFGMHARVGEKDTSLAGDRASYEFSRAFQDATQMLKLLAKVIEDDRSAQASVASGVLSYVGQLPSHKATTKQNESGRAQMSESVGRYSTLIHQSDEIDKAENVFAYPIGYGRSQTSAEGGSPPSEVDHRTLSRSEAATILSAVDSILQGKAHPSRVNASVLFDSFSEEHLLEMKVLLSYVDAIQSLGFDLDASAADLGAKRFFSMHLFSKSLTSVVRSHIGDCASSSEGAEVDDGRLNHELTKENCLLQPRLEETPSSGLLWALHSDAQKFVWEHCIESHSVWDDMRHLWLGLWIKDVKDLREIVERWSLYPWLYFGHEFIVLLALVMTAVDFRGFPICGRKMLLTYVYSTWHWESEECLVHWQSTPSPIQTR